MNSRNARFDPRKVLDSDWRKRVWKRWLRSTLADAAGSSAASQATISGSVELDPIPEPVPSENVSPTVMTPPAMPTGITPSAAIVDRALAARRGELRAKFDALCDRITALEDALDALGKRFTLKGAHERRQEQRLLEQFETNTDALERQALAIEAIQAMLSRLDQRLERLERPYRGNAGDAQDSEGRETHGLPKLGIYDEDLTDLEDAFSSEEARTGARSVFPEGESTQHCGPSIHGNLSEMSLPTVLAMLELERRTGLLKVCSDDGQLITATLRTGCIVGAKRSEVDADPVEVLGQAMRFKNGHFWFRQSSVEVVSGPPRSVGSVLLEATSRNDEAARIG